MKLNIINFTITILIIIIVIVFFGNEYLLDVSLAGIISLLNAIAGYLVFRILIKKEFHQMMKWIFRTILIRIAFMILFSYLLIHYEFVNSIPFILSLIVFYPIHQYIEIKFIKSS
ncbi:MAG: ATP synthase subunit I [Candidatus Marinimicrobia bacterium]|nr:ATP synthase subunit I [Candidatus Neomarinimicrobiota bacterium]